MREAASRRLTLTQVALVPGTRFGRYDVRSLLGAGGMGEVYLAHDPVLGRPVALKVLLPDRQQDDLLARFEQEAGAASALNHPNILTIYEFGTEDGVRFIASEYVEGTSVRDRLGRSRGPLPLAEAVDIALQAATALAAAHEARIVHRDVKPENLMVRPDGYVKVLDFGLAKRTAEAGSFADTRTVLESMAGMILGTVLYMSPEQARGIPVDTRADVWSLGCVLYEMVTARRPFEGQSIFDILAAVLDREPPSILGIRPDCPPALAALIDRMLLKDREARVQSMAQVVQELRQIGRDLESPARNEAPTPQPGVVVARPRARSAGLIAAAIAAAVVAGAGTWFWSRAPQASPAGGGSETAVAPASVRSLTYWLTVQKVRDGRDYRDPFLSSGREIFENGWKFRLHASSADDGYLYVLNEGPAEDGRTTFHMLFPDPAVNGGSAALTSASALESPWYRLTDHEGVERLWLISAAEPVAELEPIIAVVNPEDRGLVSEPEQVAAVARLLADNRVAESQIAKASDAVRTTVTGPARLLVHRVDLQHQ